MITFDTIIEKFLCADVCYDEIADNIKKVIKTIKYLHKSLTDDEIKELLDKLNNYKKHIEEIEKIVYGEDEIRHASEKDITDIKSTINSMKKSLVLFTKTVTILEDKSKKLLENNS